MFKTHDMRKKFAFAMMFLLLLLLAAACGRQMDIPTEFPTPPMPPAATPLPKITLKPDAMLEKQIAEIAKEAKGKVGVAAVLLETGDSAGLNAGEQFPMQSVYKLPIAMAVMERFRREDRSLDEMTGVTKDDMVREGQHSPLRDAHPNGGEFTIRELIRLALVESDGTASDVLLRVVGGPAEVQSYLTQIGITDIKVVNTEKEIGRDWQTQYQNWATPMATVELQQFLCSDAKNAVGPIVEGMPGICGDGNSEILLQWMLESRPGEKRLKRHLPKGTWVAHKTGTSGTQNGITAATNDIGIIWLPNLKHVAIAVFVSDSPADEKTREAVIAKIAKAVWDQWSKKN